MLSKATVILTPPYPLFKRDRVFKMFIFRGKFLKQYFVVNLKEIDHWFLSSGWQNLSLRKKLNANKSTSSAQQVFGFIKLVRIQISSSLLLTERTLKEVKKIKC